MGLPFLPYASGSSLEVSCLCPRCVPTHSPQGEGGRGIADPAGKHPEVGIVREVELQDAGEEPLRGILAKPGVR